VNGVASGPLAVVVIREGVPPLGADEVVAEAGGAALLVGSGTRDAVAELPALREAWCAEWGHYTPGTWAVRLAALVDGCSPLLCPASPDGRDLAPRLAAELNRPLLGGASTIRGDGADLVRWGGRVTVPAFPDGPFVATLLPGVRGAEPADGEPRVHDIESSGSGTAAAAHDVRVLEVLPADPATVDLAEAPRILCAGAGLCRGSDSGLAAVELLGRVATALGASLGATRVVTDAEWTDYERQIGTTGVVVDPDLHVAFGVSGAAQHIGGLGAPRHVVSVNLDAHCPMTAMADLGIVADAAELLTELADRLLGSGSGSATGSDTGSDTGSESEVSARG
jgi:electron transfer flavoprotein alpha subunit